MTESRLGAECDLFTEKSRAMFCHAERVEFLSIVPSPDAIRKRRLSGEKNDLLDKRGIAWFSVSAASNRDHTAPHVDVKLARFFSPGVGEP